MNISKILRLAMLVIGFSIFVFFITTINLEDVKNSLKNINLLALLGIISFTILNLVFKALRWKLLVLRTSKVKIPILFSIYSVLAAVAMGSILPGRAEIAKSLMLKNNYNVPISNSLSTTITDRVFEFLSLVILLLVSAALLWGYTGKYYIYLIVAVILGFVMLSGIYLLPLKLKKFFEIIFNKTPIIKNYKESLLKISGTFFDGLLSVRGTKLFIILNIISIISLYFEVLRLFFILNLFNVSISLSIATFVMMASVIFGIISFIPGGTGVIEFSQFGLFKLFIFDNLQDGAIKSAILLDRAISYYLLVLIGSVILAVYKKKSL